MENTKTLSTKHRYQSIFSRNVGSSSSQEAFSLTSVNPRFWGKHYWLTFFSTAAGYPKSKPTSEDKDKAKRFFTSFGEALPCAKCRISYRELFIRFPISEYLANRKKLLTWTYIIRDQVNRKLICQEREELKKELELLPATPSPYIDEIKKEILYTDQSPPLESILSKWYFIHEK
jgi:hypothetical protein